MSCSLCPRHCTANRTAEVGFCGAHEGLEVSAICLHTGEEPPLGGNATDTQGGIVNVFFSHCNLHCIYCQNQDISEASIAERLIHYRTVDEVADSICKLLPQSDNLLGFVTAAHYANHLPSIVEAVHQRGFNPTVVYNSSGYESVDTLRSLEGTVDIYLPDFKYMDSDLAGRYSHAPDYPDVAEKAIKEMMRQVGTGLKCDDNGIAFRGLIIRHLVLPGHVNNSLAVLDRLAQLPTTNYRLPKLSLMAQYFPPRTDLPKPLDRSISADEYNLVTQYYKELGFDGWLQELASEHTYRPDFTNKNNPFF